MTTRYPLPIIVGGLLCAVLAGCASPVPAQSAQVSVAPKVEESAAVRNLTAEVATLQQQTQQLTTTLSSLVQENGNLRASVREVQGNLSQVTQSFALDSQRRQQEQGNLIVYVLLLVIVFTIGVFIPAPAEPWMKLVLAGFGIAAPTIALIVMGFRMYRAGA
jgi:regulator of replication initiation timing